MRRLCIAVLLLASVVSAGATDDADFRSLGVALSGFRKGIGGDIALRFSSDSFQVLRMTESQLEAAQAKLLLPKEPITPTLALSEGGNWIQRRINRDTTLEEPLVVKGDVGAARKWKKRSWQSLGAFPRRDWQPFVEFAIVNGLNGIQEIRFDKQSTLTLSFAPFTPDQIDAGNRRLALNSEFRSVMRLSTKHQPKTGANGFVILLHDPHENVAGRFQALSGLRALTSANASVVFRLLVEGAYDGPSRNIGFGGLDAAIKPTAETSPAIVHGLLSRYLINTPMAYRLLYDRQIEAYAIDDNALLTYPAPRPIRPFSKQIDSLINISDELGKSKPAAGGVQAKTAIEQAVDLAFLFLSADLNDASDSILVDYYETVGQLYRSTVELGRGLRQAGVLISSIELQGLAADAAGYSDEAAIYRKALGRNKTMAPEIIKAASGQQIPVAFIGNYHTRGILAELDKASIGYVIIEPRPRTFSSDAEQKAFMRANHSNTRQAYLATARFNMGRNGPTAAEVAAFLAPKITARIPQVRAERLAVHAEFKGVAGSAVDVERLLSTVSFNGSLSSMKVAAAGNLPPPPGDFGKAFAYVDSGGDGAAGGGGRRFIVADAADRRWQDTDRYDFLRVASFGLPGRSNGASAGSTMMFYPDPGSNRLFFTFYEPKSKRVYCFEGTSQQAASLVPIPIGDPKGEQNIRTQVVEVISADRGVSND